jgi:hypothetical protein
VKIFLALGIYFWRTNDVERRKWIPFGDVGLNGKDKKANTEILSCAQNDDDQHGFAQGDDEEQRLERGSFGDACSEPQQKGDGDYVHYDLADEVQSRPGVASAEACDHGDESCAGDESPALKVTPGGG